MRFYVDGERISMSQVLKALGMKEFLRIVRDTKKIHRDFPKYINRYLLDDGVLTVR